MASTIKLLILTLTFSLIFLQPSTQTPDYQNFINCFSLHIPPSSNISQLITTQSNPSFSSLLQSSIRNLRFVTPSTRKPVMIITPTRESHIQASVICGMKQSLLIRIRSGGHDYEGLSYCSYTNQTFVILDLGHFRRVLLDFDKSTAWVDSGATLGEFYYKIAKSSNVHGFPAGICPTVGIGGHLGGGGFGTMLRKFGLAADNVLDAILVDVNGKVLDRKSMGEDLFWAIRGGGTGSFGIVVSWKVNLVPVPSMVSVFSIGKAFDQSAVELVTKWQYIAHQLLEDLFIRIVVQKNDQGTEVEAKFNSLFLGNCHDLVKLMSKSFPELGFERDDCKEMSWIDSVMYFAGFSNGEPLEILLDRGTKPYRFFKAKSDFVTKPIPEFVFAKIWPRVLEDNAGVLIMDPYGGKMSKISQLETPFPHRKGNLYNLQYFVEWTERGGEASRKHMDWITRVYNEMGPYVSKNPRASYINYRDLDIGINVVEQNMSSYFNAQIWGLKYFKNNFRRLARVKGRVDPRDFFRNEQSIPPLFAREVDEWGSESKGYQAWLEFFLAKMF